MQGTVDEGYALGLVLFTDDSSVKVIILLHHVLFNLCILRIALIYRNGYFASNCQDQMHS